MATLARSTNPDVLIAGAGPVGLTMAAALTDQGLECRIIDKCSHPTDKSKALVVWSRTLELLNNLGMAETFLANGMKIHGASVYGQGKRLVHIAIDDVASQFGFPLMIPQSETERLLAEHLASRQIAVEREVELTTFTDSGERVTGELLHADGRVESFDVPWLIGCDGAHSAVRHGLGLEFTGVSEQDDWMLADVHLKGPIAPDEVSVFWHIKGLLVFFPITPGRFRMIADLGRAADTPHPAEPTLADVQAMIDERGPAGVVVSDPVWLAGFRINERKVNEYRVGRVMLAGDAAHIHSPAGGQGMNTGMQDAFNLAWKVALVHRGQAQADVLLDSYSKERSTVGDQVLHAAAAVTRVATLRNPIAQYLRNHTASLLGSFSFVQDKIKNGLCELSINYRGGPLSGEDWHSGGIVNRGQGVPVGDRLPEGKLIDPATGSEMSLHNAIRGMRHHLLLLPGSEGADGVASLAKIANQVEAAFPGLIDPLFLLLPTEEGETTAVSDTQGIATWLDIDGALHEAHHARHATLILVRPDGYIGYRAQPADGNALLAYLDRFLLRSRKGNACVAAAESGCSATAS